MIDVIILGIDIHGIELAGRLDVVGGYNTLGFISTGEQELDSYGGYPILGGPDALKKYPAAFQLPLHVWKREEEFGKDRWISFIDPLAVVAPGAELGYGCIVFQNCFIGANAKLGDGVFMLGGSAVNHDCHIGERVIMATNASLAGCVKVGARTYIGQAATVRQYLNIGSDCLVGMGAVVIKDVPDGATVVGNPAKIYQKV